MKTVFNIIAIILMMATCVVAQKPIKVLAVKDNKTVERLATLEEVTEMLAPTNIKHILNGKEVTVYKTEKGTYYAIGEFPQGVLKKRLVLKFDKDKG